MQDGKNLFFPDEAFLGRDWDVDGSLELLDTMNATDKVVVVGIHSADRMTDYTKPGYEAYGRALVEEIVPVAKQRLRLIGERPEMAVAGSSLGGVVSFYLAWQWPKVFAAAACLSSTFSHRDDQIERVLNEPKSPAKFYLDSGWPGDNYEVTLAMALALQSGATCRAWTSFNWRFRSTSMRRLIGRSAFTCPCSSSGAACRWRCAGATRDAARAQATHMRSCGFMTSAV